jgi:hypothetical protein
VRTSRRTPGHPDQGLRLDKPLTIVPALDLRLRGLESPVTDALADLFATIEAAT